MIYPGYIIDRFRKMASQTFISVGNHQGNGVWGIHQARVTIEGDPTVYRLIVAPADAPISINGHPIGDHFAEPLGGLI